MNQLIVLLTVLFAVSIHSVAQDIVVAKDGSGDFATIQDAINSVRDYTPEPKTIFIKNGRYYEKVVIPANKCDITLIGENAENTVITYNDHANINKMGTFKTYTLKIEGNRITLKNLTVENNAPQLGQAVALHLEGHQIALWNCRLLGNQDTLFTGNENSSHFFKDCYIEGTTDFIFGPSTAWFENCQLHSKKDSFVTAASTPQGKKHGYIFHKCRLTANDTIKKVYLGRPWRAYASVVFMNCVLGKHILPEGWHNWKDPEREKTARYSEYHNSGPGANRSGRVAWSKELTKKEAMEITIQDVFVDWKIPE